MLLAEAVGLAREQHPVDAAGDGGRVDLGIALGRALAGTVSQPTRASVREMYVSRETVIHGSRQIR